MAKDFVDPCRIAPLCKTATNCPREVNENDELAIAQTIAHLVEQGIQPFIPNSHYLPFELIAVYPDMKTLKRVLVSYAHIHATSFVDQYVIYEPLMRWYVVFDVADVPQGIERITLADVNIRESKFAG